MGGANGIYDFSNQQAYFVNTATPVTSSSAIVGGPVASFASRIGQSSTSVLLAGLVLGILGYAYWTRSIDR